MSDRGLLVIVPHPDDETLGAGGTIMRCANSGVPVTILTVAAHMPPLYSEAQHQQTLEEAHKAHETLGVSDSQFLNLPAVYVNEQPTAELNGAIAAVVEKTRPQIVLFAYPDRHVDHRVIFDAVMVATRPVGIGTDIKVLAAFETLSETHWNAAHIEPNFTPNWVVDISDTIDKKLEALAHYKSQILPFPAPRSMEAVRALALFRGTQSGFAYGEAFHIIRMTSPAESLFDLFSGSSS